MCGGNCRSRKPLRGNFFCINNFSGTKDTRSVVLIRASDVDSIDNLQLHVKLTENLKIW